MRSLLLATAALAFGPSLAFAQSAAQAPSSTPQATAVPAPQSGARGEMSPEARARFEAFRAACGADMKSHCGDIQRGTDEGRAAMRQCVETHKAKFSTTCQSALIARDAAREARKQAPVAPAAEKPKS